MSRCEQVVAVEEAMGWCVSPRQRAQQQRSLRIIIMMVVASSCSSIVTLTRCLHPHAVVDADAEVVEQLNMFMYAHHHLAPLLHTFSSIAHSSPLSLLTPSVSAELHEQQQAAAAAGSWDER